VTEADWLACTDPKPMLELLRDKASDRKLRLFACGCCHRILHLLADDRSREAIEFAERYADGSATDAERRFVRAVALEASREILTSGGGDSAADMAASAVCYAVEADEDFHDPPEADEFTAGWGAAYCAVESVIHGVQRLPSRAAWTKLQEQTRQVERAVQAALLRDIFGNPFRTVTVDPSWLAWHGGTVVRLAEAIYEERRFADLPVLADALEEAGCTDEDILGHLRQQEAVHERGCWALDLLLEKE
jgi:hypothetical protein